MRDVKKFLVVPHGGFVMSLYLEWYFLWCHDGFVMLAFAYAAAATIYSDHAE
jgi:hypothetical protein